MKFLKFRSLKNKDKSLIFKWRNNKKVNQYLLRKKITSLEHDIWFKEKLKKKISFAWIIIYKKEKIGLAQVKLIDNKICNAGFYIFKRKYSYLTFFVINLLHYEIFFKLNLKLIKSYINIKNNKIRKLNKMCGYKEFKHFKKNYIFTSLSDRSWKKSIGYKYLKDNYGKL